MKAIIPLTILSLICGVVGARGEDTVSDLRSVTVGATRLVLRTGGQCHRDRSREDVLKVISDSTEVMAIASRIRLPAAASQKGSTGALFALQECGDYTMEFYRGEELLAAVTFIGLGHLRCPAINDGQDIGITGDTMAYLQDHFQLLREPEWRYDEESHQLFMPEPRKQKQKGEPGATDNPGDAK
jgi:hypothetical protein